MTEQDNRQTSQRGAVGRRPVGRRPVQGRTPVHNDHSAHNDNVRAGHSSQTGQDSVSQDSQKHSVTSAARNIQGISSSSKPVSPSTSDDNQNQERSLLTDVDTTNNKNNETNEHPTDNSGVESEDRWVIDTKTGVRHKELNRIPKNVLSAMHKVAKSGGTPSASELRFIPREKDFDSIDAFTGAGMDAMAETFLGHLRVPPNEEELKRLREEYARRQQKAAEDYKHEQDEIMSTSGDDNLTYF